MEEIGWVGGGNFSFFYEFNLSKDWWCDGMLWVDGGNLSVCYDVMEGIYFVSKIVENNLF